MTKFYDLSNSPAPARLNYANPSEPLFQFPELDARYNRTHYQNWYEAFLRAKTVAQFAVASGLSGGVLGHVYDKFKQYSMSNLRGSKRTGGAYLTPPTSKFYKSDPDDIAMNICNALENEGSKDELLAQSVGVEKDTSGKKTKVSVRRVAGDGRQRKTSLAASQMIGAQALVAPGEQTAPPLIMKLGKQIQSTKSLQNYFKYMQGSGTVNTEFAGWLNSDNNLRNGTFHCFRHNMAKAAAQTAQDSYPPNVNILSPIASSAGGTQNLSNTPGIGNPPPGPVSDTVNTDNPFVQCGNWDSWFSPINRSDYEDMSWNLNRFKFNADYSSTLQQPQVPILEENKHRQMSEIYQNNVKQVSDPAFAAPYKYDMHFKSGHVTYNFMNKGDGALVANVVVYRVKKNHKAFNAANSYQSLPATPTTPYTLTGCGFQILNPYADGYINAKNAKLGTEKLNGDDPQGDDVFMSPAVPFCKDSRFVVKGNQTFSEVQRFQFALTSGGRRTLQIKLGGDVYDPSIQQLRELQDDASTFVPELLDEHSYVVCITTQGQLATRAYDTTWIDSATAVSKRGAGRMGDMYGPSMLQWTGRYQEKIGACAYKSPGENNIQVYGGLGTVFGRQVYILDDPEDPSGPGKWYPDQMVSAEVAVTMLPQHSAIRDVPKRMKVTTTPASGGNPTSTTTEEPEDFTLTGNTAKNSDGVYGPKPV